GYKNSYVDPEELGLHANPNPDFSPPEPVFGMDNDMEDVQTQLAEKVRNRNEFLDTCRKIARSDPVQARSFVDVCTQYFFSLQEEKFKAFIRRRKSRVQKHTLEIRTDFISIKLTRTAPKLVEAIFK